MTVQEDQVEDDPYFEAALKSAQARESNATEWGALIFLGILVLVIASSSERPVTTALALAVGLTFHDIGLWIGMNHLGYVDRRMLFLPFLRASVDTTKRPKHGWLYGLVILFGPLPTAFVGFCLSILSFITGISNFASIGFMVASMAVFSLLPLAQFDGGRLLNFVLFCRYPIVELLFVLVTSACTIALGVSFKAWVLVAFGAIGILGARSRWRLSVAALQLRREYPAMEKNLADIDMPTARALYRAALSIVPSNAAGANAGPGMIPVVAQAMRNVHNQAILVPPSLGASVLLLVLYVFGFIAAAIAILVAATVNTAW